MAKSTKQSSQVARFVFSNATRFRACCVVVFLAMGKFSKKLSCALKKAIGACSNRSHGSSSAHYSTEQSKSPMHEEEETSPTEEEQEQEQPMEVQEMHPTSTRKETGRRKRTTSSRTVSLSTRLSMTLIFSER